MDLKKVQLNFIQSKPSSSSSTSKSVDDFENLVYWPANLTPCNPKFNFLGSNKLIASSDNIEYHSFDDLNSNDQNDQFNYFLAPLSSLKDNDKGKLLICKPAKIFKMLPNYSFKDEMQSADNLISNRLTKREQLDELKEKFGSKRSQRDLANKRKYEIQFGENDTDDLPTIKNDLFQDSSSNNNNKKQIKSQKTENGQDNQDLDPEQQSSSSLSTILPKRNPEAKTIEQVYSIDDIITEQERQSILDYEDQLFDSIENDYIQQLLKSTKSIDQNQKVIAIYADLLIKLVKLSAWEMRKPDPLPLVVGEIKKFLFERYTSTKQVSSRQLRYVLTDSNKDRIFIYVCLLLIHLNQFKPIDMDKLQLIYKTTMTHIRKIVELIGCYIENRKNLNGTVSKVANLRLPLNVYKESNNKLKRLKR